MTTDTLDITGTVQTQTKSSVTEEKLRGAMEQYTGMISQIPPMFSAVQVNGQRLYDLARAGQQVQRDAGTADGTDGVLVPNVCRDCQNTDNQANNQGCTHVK